MQKDENKRWSWIDFLQESKCILLGHTHVSITSIVGERVGDSVGDCVGDCVGDSLQLCRKMRTNVSLGLIFCKKANAYC